MTELDNTIEIIKAVADKNRMRILLMLSERALCVCEIDSVLGIALSTISAHLKQMRSAGVITSEKEGRWVLYTLADNDFVRSLVEDVKRIVGNDPMVMADKQKISCLCREECSKNSK